MIVNLIKADRMFSLTLPNKIKGQYWLSDLDNSQNPRNLLSIEAEQGKWTAKANKSVHFKSGNNETSEVCVLDEATFLNLDIDGSVEQAILFTEPIDVTHQTLTKIVVREAAIFTIGRSVDNNFIYDDNFVSSHHAQLAFDGENWTITDIGSRNGIFVNGLRISSQKLHPGDFIYIMGLKIVIGDQFLAINNPDRKLKIKSDLLKVYAGQDILASDKCSEIKEKQFFLRSPRFHREISMETITIDPPPPLQKLETVPLALMLGPSITMGMASASTGILTVTNTIANGGNISQALPTLVMSVSMLLGTILWPILTKKYEKKERIKAEKRRQKKYLEYLTEIGDLVRKESKEQEEILRENYVAPQECADRILYKKSNLWERIIGQNDFLQLRLGTGNLPLNAQIRYPEKKFSMDDDSLYNAMLALAESPKMLNDVPISISLTGNNILGLFGDQKATDNMLRSLLLQMVALHSYDELKILLITEENQAEKWDFVKYVPHFWDNNKSVRFFATTLDEINGLSAYIETNILSREDTQEREEYSPYYVIVSTCAKLNKQCEAIRSLLNYKNNVGFSIIIADEKFDAFPKETKVIVQVDGKHSKIFDKADTTGQQSEFSVDSLDDQDFELIAEEIANTELDIKNNKYALPSMITFLEMYNVKKVEHLNSLERWKENNPTNTLRAPVGIDADGDLFNLDLHEKFHGPHGLVAGMTGSGKSEFIITYILSLAVNYHPDEVSFILIDYKGGGLAGAFEDKDRKIKLPHLAGTITNLDGAAIKRSLTSVQSELRRRQMLFNEARRLSNEGTMDIYKYQQLYRNKIVSEPLSHLFIISDEFAELKMQQPEFMDQLISTARIGRSLGVHLILATQKPNGVVNDQIWSNSKFRVCLKVQDKADSMDMIKCPDAAELAQTGRFYLQVGFNEFFALGQSAWCGAEYDPADSEEKLVSSGVQVIDNLGHVVMDVRPQSIAAPKGKNIKQVVAIVKYLSDLAEEENINIKPLWLDPIPEKIYLEDLGKKYQFKKTEYVLDPIIGEFDDPFNQKQGVLTVPFSEEGNCLVYGAAGNGKTTFLTTLCYSLIKNYSVDEVNIYILDFGSETMKAFSAAPQVGDVIIVSEEEKLLNFFIMLKQELNYRRNLFAAYGGDYKTYCNGKDRKIPNIVVMINNYSGFAEQYEDLQDELAILTRDGVKFGIFFVITAIGIGAVRYKIQQNFKMQLTMQLNDASDYSVIVGKTDGLVPAKFKGRGLVALDKPYEFQTAYCTKEEDMLTHIRAFCSMLKEQTVQRAKSTPVLPDLVTTDTVASAISTLNAVPFGIAKASLKIMPVNLSSKVILPVSAQDTETCKDFILGIQKVLSKMTQVERLDAEKILNESDNFDAETEVNKWFEEMVLRNNTYKDANLNSSVLDQFEDRVCIIFGFKKFHSMLSDQGKDKLETLLEKAEAIYKFHFLICDTNENLYSFSRDKWYNRHLASGDGIWIGNGIADQYLLKISKITSNLYDEITTDYGYLVWKGRPTLTKLLCSEEE